MEILTVIGLACVDEKFRTKLFNPEETDKALRENGFHLSYFEHARLMQVIRPNANLTRQLRTKLQDALQKTDDFGLCMTIMDETGIIWCPIRPCGYAMYSDEGAAAYEEACKLGLRG